MSGLSTTNAGGTGQTGTDNAGAQTPETGVEQATAPEKAENEATGKASGGEDKGSGAVEGESKGSAVSGAPEKYEAFKLPDGVQLDETLVGEFQGTAKELGLTQDKAQKLMDIHAKAVKAQLTRIAEVQSEWVTSSKADKEFGGDAYDANLAVADRGINAYGTPELQEFFKVTGMNRHPEMIRLFYRLGKQVSEDNGAKGEGRGAGNAGGQKSLARRLYG